MTHLRLDMYVNGSEYMIAEADDSETGYDSALNSLGLPAQFARVADEIVTTGGSALTTDEVVALNAAYAEYRAWQANDEADQDDISDAAYELGRWAYEQFEDKADAGIREVTWCMCRWNGEEHMTSLVSR